MLKYFHVGNIGEGLFWFLVVIITIVVQILKASKKASQSGQSIQQETKGYIAPEEELQKFLESLGGGPRPSSRPVVEPPQTPAFRQAAPPPVPVRQAQQPARPTPQKKRAGGEKLVRKDETLQTDVSRRSEAETDTYLAGTRKPQFSVQALRVALGSDLISRNMLRKAIVLREIMGPPLGLRH